MNKTVPKVKFEEIKAKFDQLVEDYKNANDSTVKAALEAKFADLKEELYANEEYYRSLKNSNLKKGIKEAATEAEADLFRTYQHQKNEYKANKYFIDNVEKSNTITELGEKNSQKKRNIVKKHFNKIALGTALAALLIGGGIKLHKHKANAVVDNKPAIEQQVDTPEEKQPEVVDTSKKDDTKEEKTEFPKLNALADLSAEKSLNVGGTGNKATISINGGSGFQSSVSTTETALDPNVDQSEVSNSDTPTDFNHDKTTTTVIIPEEEKKEPEEVEFEDDQSEEQTEEETNSDKEKTTIEETEETTPTTTPENPSDTDNSNKNDQTTENTDDQTTDNTDDKEKVTIIETEETTPTVTPENPSDTDNSNKTDQTTTEQTTTDQTTTDQTTTEQTTDEEKVTIIETEETTPTVTPDSSDNEDMQTLLDAVYEYESTLDQTEETKDDTKEETVTIVEVEENEEKEFSDGMEIIDTGSENQTLSLTM